MKRRLIEAIIRLYPKRWRSVHVPEQPNSPDGRSFGAMGTFRLLAGALREQARDGEPWILLGLPLFALVAVGCLAGGPVKAPPRENWAGLIFCMAVFFLAGFWTMLRRGRAAGRAAIKMSLLACSPLTLIGLRATDPSLGTLFLWLAAMQIPFVGAIGWLGGRAAQPFRGRA